MAYALRSSIAALTLLAGLALGATGCGTSLNIVDNDGGGGEDTRVDPSDGSPSDTGTPTSDTSPTDGKPPIDAAPCVGGSKRLCGDVCVDISTSSSNCGSCGKVCPSGAFCVDGACGACPTALPTVCGSPGACVDLNTDSANCGSCGNKCPTGSVCDYAVCACGAGLVKCPGGKCVDVSSDDTNCGGCGIVCTSGKCISGSCTCSGGKTMCGGACVDTKSDPKNCGGCGAPCAGTCSGGTCSVPTCRTSPPKVLFYGPLGAMEKPYLPTGAVSVTATETMWRAMTTSDFAGYDLIVIGAPDDTLASGSAPTAAMYVAAFDTRALWGAAIDGRIAVLGMDPAFHAKTRTDAATLLRAAMKWSSTGAAGTTGLYVSSDWGERNLDFMSPFGTFASTKDLYTDTVTVTVATHPILLGSTDTTLSGWSSSAHSFVTAPSGFTTIATGTDTFSTPPTGPVITVRDAAACTAVP